MAALSKIALNTEIVKEGTFNFEQEKLRDIKDNLSKYYDKIHKNLEDYIAELNVIANASSGWVKASITDSKTGYRANAKTRLRYVDTKKKNLEAYFQKDWDKKMDQLMSWYEKFKKAHPEED